MNESTQEAAKGMGGGLDSFQDLVHKALDIWSQGGWAMYGIAFIAFVLFFVGINLLLKLKSKGFDSLPEETWRRWLRKPMERRGPVGELLDQVTDVRCDKELAARFSAMRKTEGARFERDLRVMRVFVSAAPLVGLLGTVTGMLSTFGALATGSGGDKTMGLVAEGISEALVTTETGLVVALPGLFFQYHLSRKHERYKAFLAHLESVSAQVLYSEAAERVQVEARRIAKVKLAKALTGQLKTMNAAEKTA